MSLKKIDNLKNDRGFKIPDLIVYGIIIVIVVVVFIAVFSTKDTSSLNGIKVTVQGSEVLRYNFENKEIDYIDENSATVISEDGNNLEVKVVCDDGYNIITIEKSGTVKMKEADCSKFHPDCVYMAEIKDNNGFIYCMPHGLRIEPYKYEPSNDILI